MKIGITERGDAGLDFGWMDKMRSVDGAIIISKHLSDDLIDALSIYHDRVIFHCTCTGYGGTRLEPNVPSFEQTHEQLFKLIDRGFDPERIVLRVDPIIPTEKGLRAFAKAVVLAPNKIKRVRISVLDMYPHVKERFAKLGLPDPYNGNFQASDAQFAVLNEFIVEGLYPFTFEACAEPLLGNPNVIQTGCVSERDLELLGIPLTEAKQGGYQRKDCLCVANKTELLSEKHQCSHKCAYCYWK